MSTPFYVVDHRVGPHEHMPHEDRRIVRRGAPEALRLTLPPPGLPLFVHTPVRDPAPPRERADRASRAGWIARLFRGLRHAPA